MQRRTFLAGLGALSFLWPRWGAAQVHPRFGAPLVGSLHRGSPLSTDLRLFLLATPPYLGGTRWLDLADRNVATLITTALPPTATSGAAQVTQRRGGYGEMRFDGLGDHLTIPHRATLASPTTMSWVWWARHTAAIGAGALGIWEKLQAAATGQGYFVFKNNTAQLWLTVRKGGADINFATGDNFLLGDSLWHQYAITFVTSAVTSSARIYRDGRLLVQPADQTANWSPAADNDGLVYIWRSNAFATSMTAGMGDSFMLYRRRLTDADIASLYTEALTGYPTLLRWQPVPFGLPGAGVAAAPRRRVYVY